MKKIEAIAGEGRGTAVVVCSHLAGLWLAVWGAEGSVTYVVLDEQAADALEDAIRDHRHIQREEA